MGVSSSDSKKTAKRQQISQGAGWGDLFYVIILNTLNMISVLN